MVGGDHRKWQWVSRGNIHTKISYIPQTEQDSPFRLTLLPLGNASIMPFAVQPKMLTRSL